MSIYTFKLAADTDVGPVKEVNQDSYLLKMGTYNGEQFILAMVADGMGGLSEGEMASRTLRTKFANWFDEKLPLVFDAEVFEEMLIDHWEEIIKEADAELTAYGESKGYPKGGCPGTTLSLIFIYGGIHFIAQIGDSRIYRMRNNSLRQLTKDHSWAEIAKEQGYTDEQIENDERKNKLTRCIGSGLSDRAVADYYADSCLDGDKYLICSDGLRHLLGVDEMAQVLADEKTNTKEKCRSLIDTVLERGEEDNITAVIISASKTSKEDGILSETVPEKKPPVDPGETVKL